MCRGPYTDWHPIYQCCACRRWGTFAHAHARHARDPGPDDRGLGAKDPTQVGTSLTHAVPPDDGGTLAHARALLNFAEDPDPEDPP